MASLDYVSQTDTNISVTFAGMPKDPALMFVNTTSGKKTPSASTLLKSGGEGKGDIPIDPKLGAGAFCLLAQTRDKTPQFIAQTVVFYLHKAEAKAAAKVTKKR
jgi:hypothetical protein